jgi:ribosomal protein S18 acetylase RimI-like enzyme
MNEGNGKVTTELRLRQAATHDREALYEIIELSFPRFFRPFAQHSVDSEDGKVLVGEHKGEVVGFAKLINFWLANVEYGCILWLAVHPDHRRKGVASALVKAGVENLKHDGAQTVFASVQRRNKASLATFAREGFERVGFAGLRRLFGWRTLQFYSDIWYAPTEIVLTHT